MEIAEERKRQRTAFLKCLYNAADGRADWPVLAESTMRDANLSEEDFQEAYKYLAIEKLVLGGTDEDDSRPYVCLTHKGVKAAEAKHG